MFQVFSQQFRDDAVKPFASVVGGDFGRHTDAL